MSALEDTTAAPYVHVEKLVQPEPSLMLGGTALKWYDIARDDEPVPLAVRALARRCLRDANKAGTLGIEDALGFAILHRCDEDFYFLLVSTWRNENELWETVWAKCGEADVFFHPWPSGGTHRPTFCVWELAAVCHERRAWSEYLLSSRDDEAKRRYLASSYQGVA
jgi:hypothetical protein